MAQYAFPVDEAWFKCVSMKRFIRRTSYHFWTWGINEGKGIKVNENERKRNKRPWKERKHTSLHKKMPSKSWTTLSTTAIILIFFFKKLQTLNQPLKFRLKNHQDLNKALSGARWVPDKDVNVRRMPCAKQTCWIQSDTHDLSQSWHLWIWHLKSSEILILWDLWSGIGVIRIYDNHNMYNKFYLQYITWTCCSFTTESHDKRRLIPNGVKNFSCGVVMEAVTISIDVCSKATIFDFVAHTQNTKMYENVLSLL